MSKRAETYTVQLIYFLEPIMKFPKAEYDREIISGIETEEEARQCAKAHAATWEKHRGGTCFSYFYKATDQEYDG